MGKLTLSRTLPPAESNAPRLLRRFPSEVALINEEAVPRHLRTTLLTLAIMLASLVAVSFVYPVDRTVTSIFGQIVTTEPTVVIQPLDPSIIKSLEVQEGQRVQKGQLLLSLDQTLSAADVAGLRAQLASLAPEIARCEAELEGLPFNYSPSSDDASASFHVDKQRTLFAERKAQFDSQVRTFDEQIAQSEALIQHESNDVVRYGDRNKITAELETLYTQLVAQQLESRVILLQTLDQKTELLRNLEDAQNTIKETQHALQSLKGSRSAFIEQWHAQTSQELITARTNYDTVAQQLEKALKHDQLVQMVAPDDAVVLRIAKLSVGSVVQPSDVLIELALERSPLEAEIYIDPRDIGFIRPGDTTAIKLDAYHFVEHGWAEGKLRWVSQGTFISPSTGTGGKLVPGGTSPGDGVAMPTSASESGQAIAPFYKARVAITRVDLKNVPSDFRLVPGMTLNADLHVGTRSLFWYLVRGIVRGFDEAMREP
jgi:HlyD family secretion protein